jgi:ABC-type transport system substrate-binding protein
MTWQLGNSASSPDALSALGRLYGPNAGLKGNFANFKLAEFDRLYEKSELLAHSPERTHLFQEMSRLVATYAPWRIATHRVNTDLWSPKIIGFRRPQILVQNWWKYIDIDNSLATAR